MLIFNIIFPIFAIAGLGYLFATAGLFQQKHVQGLSQYVFYVAIPTLLFQSLSQIALPQQINWPFFSSYYLVVACVYAAGYFISRNVFGTARKSAAISGMASSYSNMVLIGLPVITASFGDEGLVPLFLLISIHSASQFSATTLLAESSSNSQTSWATFLKLSAEKLFKNPIIIALIAGLLFNWLTIPIPDTIFNTLILIRSSALPAALFMLGASLTAYTITGQASRAFTIVGLKMFVAPFLVYLLVTYVFDLPELWASVAVVTGALPVGVNSAVFANKYNAAVAPVGSAVLLSTLLSAATLSFLLTLFI